MSRSHINYPTNNRSKTLPFVLALSGAHLFFYTFTLLPHLPRPPGSAAGSRTHGSTARGSKLHYLTVFPKLPLRLRTFRGARRGEGAGGHVAAAFTIFFRIDFCFEIKPSRNQQASLRDLLFCHVALTSSFPVRTRLIMCSRVCRLLIFKEKIVILIL